MKDQPQPETKKKPEFKANKPFPMVAIGPGACELVGPNPATTTMVRITGPDGDFRDYDSGTHSKAQALVDTNKSGWDYGLGAEGHVVILSGAGVVTGGQLWTQLVMVPTISGSNLTFTYLTPSPAGPVNTPVEVQLIDVATATKLRSFVKTLVDGGWDALGITLGLGWTYQIGSTQRAQQVNSIVLQLALPAGT